MEMPSVNSNAPLVSVVIPTYSRSDMLTRAMESVNAQTYPKVEAGLPLDWDRQAFEAERKMDSKKHLAK